MKLFLDLDKLHYLDDKEVADAVAREFRNILYVFMFGTAVLSLVIVALLHIIPDSPAPAAPEAPAAFGIAAMETPQQGETE